LDANVCENKGKRKGYPTIGNCVHIGINATVVGNINIGDDVIIAAGAFVNHDVPSYSICIGNPCRVIPRYGATDGYIINRVGAE
jgi:serine O-acetyltransferase